MIERAVLVFVLVGLGFAAYRLFVRRQLRRAAQNAPADPLLSDLKPGVPTILYFTTPLCAPCRTQQWPALTRLQVEFGDAVQIIRVDATENPEAAERWGVFCAPTTFILDGSGKPYHVNHGVADCDQLKQQLQGVTAA